MRACRFGLLQPSLVIAMAVMCACAPAAADRIEAEARKIYERVDPGQLSKLPSIMSRYKGREQQLLLDLRDKYPDEPPTISPGPLDAPGSIESRVCSFYRQFVPERVGSLPKILFRYKGREQQLLADVKEKYFSRKNLSRADIPAEERTSRIAGGDGPSRSEHKDDEAMDDEAMDEDAEEATVSTFMAEREAAEAPMIATFMDITDAMMTRCAPVAPCGAVKRLCL